MYELVIMATPRRRFYAKNWALFRNRKLCSNKSPADSISIVKMQNVQSKMSENSIANMPMAGVTRMSAFDRCDMLIFRDFWYLFYMFEACLRFLDIKITTLIPDIKSNQHMTTKRGGRRAGTVTQCQ